MSVLQKLQYRLTGGEHPHGSGASRQRFVIDKKTVEKCYRQMDSVVRLCSNRRINLNNSPPFILDILPETYQYIKSIFRAYDDRFEELNDVLYFRIFFENLIAKCKFVYIPR